MDLSIDELKCYLTVIIRNEIDKFTLVNLAKKLNVCLNYEEGFFCQKKKVEHEILQHILQQDQSEQFSERLAETRSGCLYCISESSPTITSQTSHNFNNFLQTNYLKSKLFV